MVALVKDISLEIRVKSPQPPLLLGRSKRREKKLGKVGVLKERNNFVSRMRAR